MPLPSLNSTLATSNASHEEEQPAVGIPHPIELINGDDEEKSLVAKIEVLKATN
jgi:hypothetical protein